MQYVGHCSSVTKQYNLVLVSQWRDTVRLEGDCRSDNALATRHRHSSIMIYGLKANKRKMSTPAYALMEHGTHFAKLMIN